MEMKEKLIKKRSAGKGDKRRPFNYVEFCKNYDIAFNINIRCCNCGISIKREQLDKFPDLYIKYEDGEIECKNCNFN